MKELMEFLTSKEIIVVYILTALACFSCFIFYLVEKNNGKLRKKHNTRELNKLVEAVKEETDVTEETIIYKQPVLQTTMESQASSVTELIESTVQIKQEKETITNTEEPVVAETPKLVIEPIDIISEVAETQQNVEEELQYTSAEPDQATAKLELKKLTEELKKQAEEQPKMENIALTNYEEEQEEKAIISLEELMQKSREMYKANELTQYADEGNEPISIQDLEKKMGEGKIANYDEPFIIENVVPKEELENLPSEAVTIETSNRIVDEPVVINDVNSEVKIDNTVKKFQSSPIISPIYGIERNDAMSSNELELENTANYEKLDEEIRKTNEFLMTLKELQKHLD